MSAPKPHEGWHGYYYCGPRWHLIDALTHEANVVLNMLQHVHHQDKTDILRIIDN